MIHFLVSFCTLSFMLLFYNKVLFILNPGQAQFTAWNVSLSKGTCWRDTKHCPRNFNLLVYFLGILRDSHIFNILWGKTQGGLEYGSFFLNLIISTFGKLKTIHTDESQKYTFSPSVGLTVQGTKTTVLSVITRVRSGGHQKWIFLKTLSGVEVALSTLLYSG